MTAIIEQPEQFPWITDPTKLTECSQLELDMLFDELSVPDCATLDGPLAGEYMAVIGLEKLPRFIRSFLHKLLNLQLLNPWKGKMFTGDRGANMWFSPRGAVLFGSFNVKRETIKDNRQQIIFDYERSDNPKIMQPILGELRMLGPQYYLARMNYRTKNKNIRVLYFTLS